MPGLRKATAVVAVAATLVASFPASPVLAQPPVLPATATPTAPVDPAALIGSTIKAFPQGGEPLKLAISDLVVQHPQLAGAIANYLRTDPSLTPLQRQAIADGLSDALNRHGVVFASGCAGPTLTKAPPADCGQGGEDWVLPAALLVLLAGGVGAGIWALTNNEAGPPPVIQVSPN